MAACGLELGDEPGSSAVTAVVAAASECHGATDDLGYNAEKDVVTVHDFHATLLHLFGIDYRKFSYKFQGLDFRLTGVEPAQVVKPILA